MERELKQEGEYKGEKKRVRKQVSIKNGHFLRDALMLSKISML